MLNIQQITSELARLPDQSLQHYAMMHKDDPYVLSLAMSESNRRKEMRSGAQMQAPQQPSVVDQAVASMGAQPMPENVGIGQLPAQNIQHMADGGIAGYAEGGPNPASGPAGQLAYNNEPVLRMAEGGIARFNGEYGSQIKNDSADVQRVLQKSPYDRTPEDNALLQQAGYELQRQSVPADSGVARANAYLRDLGPKIRNYFTAGASNLSDAELASRPNAGGVMNERILRGLGLAPSESQAAVSAQADTGSTFIPGAGSMGTEPTGTAPAVRPISEAPKTRPPAQKPAATKVDAAKTEVAPAFGLESLMGRIENRFSKEEPTKSQADYLKERAAYLGADPSIAQAERLAKLEEKSKGDKDTALGNALMQMGLGMMSARAVPGGKFANLLSAAGEGGKAGLKSLEESTREIKAAERDREKLRSSIENAQYALKIGDLDAYNKYRKEEADLKERRSEHLAAAESHLAGIAMQGQTQRAISADTNATHLMAARISAAGHDPLALYRALGNGDVTAGYTLAKQDPIRAQMTEKWSAQAYPATGMANEAFIKRYPTPETYIQEALTMQGGGGGGAGSGGPLVRSR